VALGCISYFPAAAILGIDDPLGSQRWMQVAAPLAGYLFFGVSLVAWRFGIRHYTSTGS
jgi:ABC-2 type transport system permease protein